MCTFSKGQQHNHEGEEEDLDGDSVNLHYPGDSLLLFRSLGELSKTFQRILSVKGVPPPYPLNGKQFCQKNLNGKGGVPPPPLQKVS